MQRGRLLLAVAGAVLLEALPLVAAHGDEHAAMDMPGMEESPSSPAPTKAWDKPPSYFGLSEHSGKMYAHIAIMTLAWVFLLPAVVMLSIARSRLNLLFQVIFLALNGLGLLIGVVYSHSTPDRYTNDSHSKIGWIATWMVTIWVVLGVVNMYAGYVARRRSIGQASHPMTTAAMAQYRHLQNEEPVDESRWSGDSGQGTERNSASLAGDDHPSPSVESERTLNEPHVHFADNDDDDDEIEIEKRSFLRNTAVDRFLARSVSKVAVGRSTFKAMRAIYVIIERIILILGFIALTTGVVVYGGIARGNDVFSVLAHFIKGGIFVWYGLLTLGRWLGMFADFGWAWNIKPAREVVGPWRAWIPSGEFTESFVIWLYGISNVFLEHLAAWGDAWSPQDLEHVSISVMFFGGGLLGMLIESTTVRSLLSSYILDVHDAASAAHLTPKHDEANWEAPKSWRVPLNPVPALVIMLLGIMMSGHHQASMLSTMIHKQWGTLFVGFALARGVTYLLLYLSPPQSHLPSRPPTEIITSFCLVAGGITFMVSNKDTVAVLESYGLDAMFTLTVTIGATCAILAWEVFVCALKGWASRRESRGAASRSAAAVPRFAGMA